MRAKEASKRLERPDGALIISRPGWGFQVLSWSRNIRNLVKSICAAEEIADEYSGLNSAPNPELVRRSSI